MDIEKEAEKVLKELSEALGEINLSEMYYVVEEINITRGDGEPDAERGFRGGLSKNVKLDEEGYYVMEVGKWVE